MIKLTVSAARQIMRSAVDGKMEGLPLRISAVRDVRDQFHYGMGFDDQNRPDDVKFESEGVAIVAAGVSLPLIKDMMVDYVNLDGEFNFIFLNPNDPDYVPPRE